MRYFILLLFVNLAWAGDPVRLRTDVVNDKYLIFTLNSKYASAVTRYEVSVDYLNSGLSCSVSAEVKRPEDLHPAATCGLPTEVVTGKVAEKGWKARIVYVEFADGMRWTPK